MSALRWENHCLQKNKSGGVRALSAGLVCSKYRKNVNAERRFQFNAERGNVCRIMKRLAGFENFVRFHKNANSTAI